MLFKIGGQVVQKVFWFGADAFCVTKTCHVLVSCVRIAVLKNRRLAQLVRAPR